MQITDYDKVYALWLSCPGMGLNNLDDSREGIDKFLKRNPDTCFVAEIKSDLVNHAIHALEKCGINKVALVVFEKNEDGNAFWEKVGFTVREDLVYWNKNIVEMIRMNT